MRQRVAHLTLTNCTTVRSFAVVFMAAMASTDASILVPLKLAMSLRRCLQLGPCKCRGRDLPYGSEMIGGISSVIGVSCEDTFGAMKPMAAGNQKERRKKEK